MYNLELHEQRKKLPDLELTYYAVYAIQAEMEFKTLLMFCRE
jgi:hypothetical protein